MIKSLIRLYLINVFALWLTSQYILGFVLSEGLKSLLVVSFGFTLLHVILKPILKMFLGILSFLTLGLIDLVIDGGILYLLTMYFPQISIISWQFNGLSSEYLSIPPYELGIIQTVIISALLINVVRSILSVLSSE